MVHEPYEFRTEGRIAAVLIAKDEEATIGRCLESARATGIGPITVLDTGSTDRTPEIAAEHGAIVRRTVFRDFGQARSEAFALARGTGDWIAALDADMTVEIDPDFVPDPAVDVYILKMGTGDFEYRLPLLLRGDLPWRSVGAVHEYTTLPDRPYIGIPTDRVRITNHGAGRSSPEKSRWHAELLEAEHAADPSNARTIFYLAQTYKDLGRYDEARQRYDQRRFMGGGFVEEVFYSTYMAATLTGEWPDRLVRLLEAWELRPGRLEPLYEAVRGLNERGQHQAAYALALRAEWRPEPSTDILFVHASVWRWGMDFERSIAEWWCGSRAESHRQMDDLLTRDLPGYIKRQVELNRAL